MKLSPEPTSQRRVAIYIRVSTAEQKIDGYSLEAQEKRLRDYAKNNSSLEIDTRKIVVFADAHTGSDLNRPQLQALLKRAKAGEFDAILVWKIDRLSRSLKHLLGIFEDLKSYQCSLISVQENIDFRGAIGNLIFQIFGAIAQFERELIKSRTLMGKIASAEQGNWISGQVPYGYRKVRNPNGKGSKLEIVDGEKGQVQQIFHWYIYEGMGHLKIAKKMNTLKIPRGEAYQGKDRHKPWTEADIRRIVEHPVYRGEYVANDRSEEGELLPPDQWTIVQVPAIISELTYQQARSVQHNRTGGNRKVNTYLLSGKLVDMSLDRPKKFSGAKRHKGGYSYRRKQFSDKTGQHHSVFEVPAKPIEDYVWEKILAAMQNPEAFIKHYLTQNHQDLNQIETLEKELNQLKEQKINLEAVTIPRIEQAYEQGIYSEAKVQTKLTTAETQLNQLEEAIQMIEDKLGFLSSVDLEAQKLKEAAEQVQYRLENLSTEQKRVLCDLFIERIEMNRTKVGKRWQVAVEVFFRFNPERAPFVGHEGRTALPANRAEKVVNKDEIEGIGDSRRT